VDRALVGCATKRKGDSSEALILSKLVDAGITVLIPWGDNARFDLVAVFDTAFIRIQCKTGRLKDGYVAFDAYGTGRGGKRHQYRSEEIDYHGVRCFETSAIFLVPFGEAGPSAAPQL
jgi:hypothetical protein